MIKMPKMPKNSSTYFSGVQQNQLKIQYSIKL